MPTVNKRVAAYLPANVRASLEAFKTERNIKGDSQALIVILSEFLGVSQQVAYPVAQDNSEIVERIQSLESRLESLKDDLLNELLGELLKTERALNARLAEKLADLAEKSLVQRAKEEIKSELQDELVKSSKTYEVPGQLSLAVGNQIEDSQSTQLDSESVSDSHNEPRQDITLPESMTGKKLSARLGLSQSAAYNARELHKDNPDKFAEWSRQRDPDKLAWQYDSQTRRYYPIVQDVAIEATDRGIPERA